MTRPSAHPASEKATGPAAAAARRPAMRLRPALGALACGLLASCTPRNAYQPPPPPTVTVRPPERRDVTDYFEQTGQLASVRSIPLVARVEGYLTSIGYKDGEQVGQGATLFTIEQEPYKAKLDQAEANLAAAKAKSTFADQQFDRFSTLANKDYAPQMQAQQYTADRDAARASVLQAGAALEQARITYSYTTVATPFPGKVSAHMQDVGAYVGTAETTKLATLVQTDPIWANFAVSESDALQARALVAARGGSKTDLRDVAVEVGLQDETGYPHGGHVDYMAPDIDPGTGTLAIRAVFDNADDILVPGAFVRIRVPIRRIAGALLVPETALGNVQGEPTVLVVDGKNVVAQRAVTLGVRQGDLRVVEKGLAPDDRVIVEGVGRVGPGETVAPREEGPAPAPVGKP